MVNQIIVAMDMEIPEGMNLIAKTRQSEKIYGYKIGSLWILEDGMSILREIKNNLNECDSNQKIILDMQKWGTDIPDIIKKQVEKVAPYVDELICCPMGAGYESMNVFAKTCIMNNVKPICVLEMTQPEAGKYLKEKAYLDILNDCIDCEILDFVIPATKEPKFEINVILLSKYYPNGFGGEVHFYATGFKVQGGQTKPMVDFGVTKFIVGRAVYEAEKPIEAIENIYKEINEV